MSEHGLINLYHLARTSECDWHVKEGGGAHFSKPSVGITQALRGLMNYTLPFYLYTSQTVLLSTITSSLASLAGYWRTQQCNNRSHFFRGILDFAKKLCYRTVLVVLHCGHLHTHPSLTSPLFPSRITTPEHDEHGRESTSNPFPCSQEIKSSVGPKITGPNSHNEAISNLTA